MKNTLQTLDQPDQPLSPTWRIVDAGTRLANFLGDFIALCLLLVVALALLVPVTTALDPMTVESILLLVLWTLFFGYYLLFEYFLGRTPGKFLTRTRVVTATGAKPGFRAILLRTLCRFYPLYVFSFLSGSPVGWHDQVSGTKVVREVS